MTQEDRKAAEIVLGPQAHVATDHPVLQSYTRHRTAAIRTLEAEVARLRTRANEMAQETFRWREKVVSAEARATAAEAKLAEAREVVAYYADEARWTPTSAGITPAMDDKGHRARNFLSPKEPS